MIGTNRCSLLVAIYPIEDPLFGHRYLVVITVAHKVFSFVFHVIWVSYRLRLRLLLQV